MPERTATLTWATSALLLSLAACSTPRASGGADTGQDAAPDAPTDAAADTELRPDVALELRDGGHDEAAVAVLVGQATHFSALSRVETAVAPRESQHLVQSLSEQGRGDLRRIGLERIVEHRDLAAPRRDGHPSVGQEREAPREREAAGELSTATMRAMDLPAGFR